MNVTTGWVEICKQHMMPEESEQRQPSSCDVSKGGEGQWQSRKCQRVCQAHIFKIQ